MGTENVLQASKQIKRWVDTGLLMVVNPLAAKALRKYTKPGFGAESPLFSLLDGK